MTCWQIHIPHRSRDESLVDVASHCRKLGQDDARVMRQIVFSAQIDRGLTSAGELIDHLNAMEPGERRALLDQAREECGFEAIATVEARERESTVTLRTISGGGFPECAVDGCNAAPTRLGGFYVPDVRRWHCEAHEHLAQPGDLEPRGSGIKLSPSGVPVPDDPAADAADRDREASRRAQLQAEAEIRAVDGAELAASNRLRDAAQRAELPAHQRR